MAKESGETCLLSFSLGKDSICAWSALRPHFKRIVPFYLHDVPGLEFIEKSIRYFERKFKTKIIQVPHPSLYRKLRNFTFQAPENCLAIEAANLRQLEYADIEDYVRRKSGAGKDAFVALGTRTADSPIRLANMRRYGPINYKRNSFWAVYDWRIADVVDCLKKNGLKLPVDYKLFGRSYDGIDYRFLAPIKEHFPRDYARILEYFPLAELELKRREWSPHQGAAK